MAQREALNAAERFGQELDGWEEKLHLLHVLYEKYFLGIDRKPPDKDRKIVSEGIRRLRTGVLKNTMMRYRLQTLFNKLLSYERMWDRTLGEMEKGTYRRDVFKAKMHLQRKQLEEAQRRQQQQGLTAEPLPLPPLPDGPEIGMPSSPPPPARASQPPPSSISDSSMKRLYETYLKAREQCGESNAGLTYDALASKIKSQIPSLLTKHNARAVDFKVVIKGGKAILKAVPKT